MADEARIVAWNPQLMDLLYPNGRLRHKNENKKCHPELAEGSLIFLRYGVFDPSTALRKASAPLRMTF
jgi:hypothetical protein